MNVLTGVDMSEITNKELANLLFGMSECNVLPNTTLRQLKLAAERLAAMPDAGDRLYGFDVGDLEDISDSLLEGYEQKINVGNVTGEGDSFVDSTTKAAAEFIKAVLAQPQQPAPDKETIKRAYAAGFMEACRWPSPVTQDADSKAFESDFESWWQQQSAEGGE